VQSLQTRASIPLDCIRRPRDTPIWKLEASLKCRSCRKVRTAPPIYMIKLSAQRTLHLTNGCIRARRIARHPTIDAGRGTTCTDIRVRVVFFCSRDLSLITPAPWHPGR
jgi:hypothetical protein